MQCDACKPSLRSKFAMFKMKIDIEKSFGSQNDRNSSLQGSIDVKLAYTYEKLFQKYALREYVAAHLALNFWRELMSKTINANSIQ
jgi:hypothetical protein